VSDGIEEIRGSTSSVVEAPPAMVPSSVLAKGAGGHGSGATSRPLRVLVCGGREYTNQGHIHSVLSSIHGDPGISAIIHGAARGADLIAGVWAWENGVREMAFPADWNRYDNRAGPIRNAQMLKEGRPDLVVAFPGGNGTNDMVMKARYAGVPVRIETA
jgi:hypothetical protein